MSRKIFSAAVLVWISLSLGACGGSDTDRSSVDSAKTSTEAGKHTATAKENSGALEKKSGGQLTVISGADKGIVRIRSTGFR